MSSWVRPEEVIRGEVGNTHVLKAFSIQSNLSLREMMMRVDTSMYLPDDILVKLDRASMAVSLEARVPLLDHRVVEYASRIPMHLKQRRTTSKWVLRQVLYRHVPVEIMDRPKMGFSVPIETWLRGPLRDWAEDLLAEDKLSEPGHLNPELIRREWKLHLNGTRRSHYRLWNVLMFQAWLADQSGSIA
jgi:asparagine synthase (glutamine-hydrolysing)